MNFLNFFNFPFLFWLRCRKYATCLWLRDCRTVFAGCTLLCFKAIHFGLFFCFCFFIKFKEQTYGRSLLCKYKVSPGHRWTRWLPMASSSLFLIRMQHRQTLHITLNGRWCRFLEISNFCTDPLPTPLRGCIMFSKMCKYSHQKWCSLYKTVVHVLNDCT